MSLVNHIKVISLAVLFALMLCPFGAYAVTWTVGPSDCSASATQTAINSASDGDIVELTCTGTVTWTATVNTGTSAATAKAITLRVAGGTNTPKASANFPLIITKSGGDVLSIWIGANKPVMRVSGFKFQGGVTNGNYFLIRGNGRGITPFIGAFRIDNNYFDNINGNVGIYLHSTNNLPLYGLIDNNTFHDLHNGTGISNGGIYGIQIWNHDHDGDSCWGKNGWTDAFAFGDSQNVFIEDNLFDNITTDMWMRHYVSSELGGRYVVRHNEFNVTVEASGNKTDLLDGHGICLGSNGAGARGGEIYANTFGGTMMNRVGNLRGGTWLMYDNTFNDTPGSYISWQEYRAGAAGDQSQCASAASHPCNAVWNRYFGPIGSDTTKYPLAQQIGGGVNGAGSDPSYVWNNLRSGVNQCGTVNAGGVQPSYIQADRDYFCSTSQPAALSSYEPYTYPHPLRGGPSEPQNLRIISWLLTLGGLAALAAGGMVYVARAIVRRYHTASAAA